MIRHLLLFGATGDLARRYLLPALARLREAGELPDGFRITALGRREGADDFRALAAEALDEYASGVSAGSRREVLGMLEYQRADSTDSDSVEAALGDSGEPVVAYLALPPGVFAPTVKALAGAGLPEGSRVVLEKPFGEDLRSAQELNRLLHETFSEEAVFRVDHFLAMRPVRNVLGVRFANRVFEPLWSGEHVDSVEVLWNETLALEGRAGYYDGAGALKDMIQNHLLQVMCFVGMEPPTNLDDGDLRDRKVDLLRAVRRPSPEEIARYTVRARYAAGRIRGEDVPAYKDEEGVDPARETETFAAVTLFVDNPRWSGVPFVLRSGKALPEDRAEVTIRFKPVPRSVFGQGTQPAPNVLRFSLYSDRIALDVEATGPGDSLDLEPAQLGADLTPQELPAYAHVLLGALGGDPTLSVRGDEAEEAWRIVEPVLDAWREGKVPLLEYPAGLEEPRVPTP